MARQGSDIAPGRSSRPCWSGLSGSVVVRLKDSFGGEVAQIERALIGIDRGRLLRLRPEDQRLQSLDHLAQPGVLRVEIKDHPGQGGGVARELGRVRRHARKST